MNLRAIPDLVVAGCPVPLVFGEGRFESGVAAKVLREFAQDPFSYLDEAGEKSILDVFSGLRPLRSVGIGFPIHTRTWGEGAKYP